MSTHSTIWIKKKDGTDNGIYCHFDGYLSGVGQTLLDHYQSKEKISELIALGALSSLEIDNGTCVAYHRDHGEDITIYSSMKPPCYLEEYNYVWKNNKWYVTFDDNNLVELTQSLINGDCT